MGVLLIGFSHMHLSPGLEKRPQALGLSSASLLSQYRTGAMNTPASPVNVSPKLVPCTANLSTFLWLKDFNFV